MGQAFNKLAGEHGAGNGEGHSKEAAVAKTAGFFVFSGIAMSILKALNSCNNDNNKLLTHSVTEPSQPTDPSHSREPIFKVTQLTHLIWKIFYILYGFLLEFSCVFVRFFGGFKEKEVRESTQKTIDIVKGDTLWGLSRKHGVFFLFSFFCHDFLVCLFP